MQHPLAIVLQKDARYKLEAYDFVREALGYAQDFLQMGQTQEEVRRAPEVDDAEDPGVERHLTGQELCEAIRQYVLAEYGYMAKAVLGNWGIHCTSDFGEIVYNLINVGLMKKSDRDRREDFDDVYDFDEALCRQFQIAPPD